MNSEIRGKNGPGVSSGVRHSGPAWGPLVEASDGVLKPVVARYQGKVSRIYFRADATLAMPEVYQFLPELLVTIHTSRQSYRSCHTIRRGHRPGTKVEPGQGLGSFKARPAGG